MQASYKTQSSLLMTEEYFSKVVMAPFAHLINEVCVVAVSGGSDSLALALLMHAYAKKHHLKLYTFTVDHQLRPESIQEALRVSSLMKSFNVFHEILTWHHTDNLPPQTKIQEQARKARYELLWSASLKVKSNILMTAHHQDDQVETFVMRLNHKSGVKGLSCMKPLTPYPFSKGALLIRPLLEIKKETLQEYLISKQVNWIQDPSNQKHDYERVRVRGFLEMAENNGFLDSEAMSQSIKKIQEANKFIEDLVEDFLAKEAPALKPFLLHEKLLLLGRNFQDSSSYTKEDLNALTIDLKSFRRQPLFLQKRIIEKLIQIFSWRPYGVADLSIERLVAYINSSSFKKSTCAGLLFYHKSPWLLCIEKENRSKSTL